MGLTGPPGPPDRLANPNRYLDMGIHHVQKGVVGGISIAQAVAQARCKIESAVTRALQPAEQDVAGRGELAEINRYDLREAPVISGSVASVPRFSTVSLVEAHRTQPPG